MSLSIVFGMPTTAHSQPCERKHGREPVHKQTRRTKMEERTTRKNNTNLFRVLNLTTECLEQGQFLASCHRSDAHLGRFAPFCWTMLDCEPAVPTSASFVCMMIWVGCLSAFHRHPGQSAGGHLSSLASWPSQVFAQNSQNGRHMGQS